MTAPPTLLRLVCVLAAVWLVGCGGPRHQLAEDEVELVAWYAEDVAHGLDRDPFELVSEDASDGRLQIATWALARIDGGQASAHPAILTGRRSRWPVVQRGFREGLLAIDPADGQLVPAPDTSLGTTWQELLAQENLDRLQTARILLARGEITAVSLRGRQLLATLRDARLAYAISAGGSPWPPRPSASTSTNAPTTSTSNQDPSPRRIP